MKSLMKSLSESLFDADFISKAGDTLKKMVKDEYRIINVHLYKCYGINVPKDILNKCFYLTELSEFVKKESKNINYPVPTKYKSEEDRTDVNDFMFLFLTRPLLGYEENMCSVLKKFLRPGWKIDSKTEKSGRLIYVEFQIWVPGHMPGYPESKVSDYFDFQIAMKKL